VHEYIWNETASQVAFDVGSTYRTTFLNMRIGMSIHNVSGKLKFEGDDIDRRIEEELAGEVENNPRVERLTPEFRLPQVFHLGVAFEPVQLEQSSLTVIADVDVPSDNEQRVITALEYGFQNFAFIRGAYRMNYDSGDLAFGGGLNLELMGVRSQIDYAFSVHNELSNIHRFGMRFTF
jgi:hypothetical protein